MVLQKTTSREPTKKVLPFICLLVLTFIIIGANNSYAALSDYVKKHSTIQASTEQLNRLSEIDHLIEYFSSFEFFRPNRTVNPNFIRALILAESNCNTTALSNKKAIGLTQILFSTGKEAAEELYNSHILFDYIDNEKLGNLQPAHLNEPSINILLACYLISKYNHSFSGRLDLVLSAWNAGASTIKNNQPPEYQETYELIGRVNGYILFFKNKNNETS